MKNPPKPMAIAGDRGGGGGGWKPSKFMLVRKVDTTPTASLKAASTTGTVRTSISVPKQPPKSKIAAATGTTYLLGEQAIRTTLDSVKSQPGLGEQFVKLNPQFKQALISSFVNVPAASAKARSRAKPDVSPHVISVTNELVRQEKVWRVGVLDMGAWIGALPALLERLNAAQPLFTIFEIQAPMPGGLLKTRKGMIEWAQEQHGIKLSKADRAEMDQHVIADDYFVAAEDIRRNMGLDFIVGITPALVAGVDDEGYVYWNHFSSVSGKTILVSTADLREFAGQAARPFEAAVGALLIPTLLIAINRKLGYHVETKGCLFDYNEDRTGLVSTLKSMDIDDGCMRDLTPEQRDAALAMIVALKRMKRRAK